MTSRVSLSSDPRFDGVRCNAVRAVDAIHRRDLLRIGGTGLFGVTLPRLLQASEQSAAATVSRRPAKSVIFLFQWGGPSHVDTFDMKPEAPDGYRSLFSSIASSVPGISVCEHLPETAKVMHHVAQIRTVHHTMNNHNSAGYTALTGVAPPIDDQRLRDSLDLMPGFGSVVDYAAPNTNGMPTSAAFPYTISDGSITPGQRASFLGKLHDPLYVADDPNAPDFRLSQLSLPAGVSLGRLEDRRELQQIVNQQARALDASAAARGLNAYYERAIAMLNSQQVRDAFDISREANEIREAYGRTTYGQSCLLARRLVERGVRFIQIQHGAGGAGKWDAHGGLKANHTRNALAVDQPIGGLLADLDRRGMLDDTLVI
ncbi:MAG: DUF1501 domain-containing protein, partial [Planctomycetaceae bacterium]|nr:DUF1501 domain-containing protein [Planctomycetaceae bacterium]